MIHTFVNKIQLTHLSLTGSYTSTDCKKVAPSYPPQTYSFPFKTATPSRHRFVCIGVTEVQVHVLGLKRST